MGENVKHAKIADPKVILPYKHPMKKKAGFKVLRGNLFDSAIMKTSVISEEFRKRYLTDKSNPGMFEGRAVVFDGREDYHDRIDDPKLKIDERTMLFIRGVGPIGYPGAAEVVNMQPPAALIKKGILSLPCIGDGRQSGTSGSPSILNASPEAAAGGGLALLEDRRHRPDRPQQGHRQHQDLERGTRAPQEGAASARAATSSRKARRPGRKSSAAWSISSEGGMVLKPAVKYQDVAHTKGTPRDSH